MTYFYDLIFTGEPYELTCDFHPDLRWLSKGQSRGLHFLGHKSDGAMPKSAECICAPAHLHTV